MGSIVTFSPFHELHRFAEQMDRMWDSNQGAGNFGSSFSVPLDIWEQDGNLYVKAAIPGVDPENIELNVENGVLTLSGEFKNEQEVEGKDKKYYHREFRYGRFSRSITLPDDVDPDRIEAEYNNGFITVRVPRNQKQAPQAKRLQIRNASAGQGQSVQQRGQSVQQRSDTGSNSQSGEMAEARR